MADLESVSVSVEEREKVGVGDADLVVENDNESEAVAEAEKLREPVEVSVSELVGDMVGDRLNVSELVWVAENVGVDDGDPVGVAEGDIVRLKELERENDADVEPLHVAESEAELECEVVNV